MSAMRLSEAILLGSMMSKPARCAIVDCDEGRCANGAALLAIGRGNAANLIDIWTVWPWTARKDIPHPANGEVGWAVWAIVTNLNDVWEWSRERIADWVATVEPKGDENGRDAGTASTTRDAAVPVS